MYESATRWSFTRPARLSRRFNRVLAELRPRRRRRFNFTAELQRQHPDKQFERPPGVVAYRLVSDQRHDSAQLVAAISHYGSRAALAH